MAGKGKDVRLSPKKRGASYGKATSAARKRGVQGMARRSSKAKGMPRFMR